MEIYNIDKFERNERRQYEAVLLPEDMTEAEEIIWSEMLGLDDGYES